MLCLRDWKWIFLAREKHKGMMWFRRAGLLTSTAHRDKEMME